MINTVFIGIDVGSKFNVVCTMNHLGEKLWTTSFANSAQGTQELVERLCKDPTSQGCFLRFGLEATGCYGNGLAMFLRETPKIPGNSKAVHLLNPKQIKRFHDSYSDLPKDDATDAFVIADSLRFGRIGMKGTIVEDKYLALQRLTRWRLQCTKELSREKNRYLQNLFLKFSSMAQVQGTEDKLFSNTFGVTAMALVEDFDSVDEIAYTPIETLVEFLVDKSKNHFLDPEELACSIQQAARGSYRLPKLIQDSVNQVLAMQARTIRFYEKQLKEVDKAIEDLMKTIPCTLTSIPGIGPVYAAGIIAEIGDIHRFSSEAALAKYAGLTWTKKQSGDFESDRTRLISGGNKFLRYYFIEAADHVRKHDKDYQNFYASKLKEVKNTPHKRALVLTARKLVRLVFALLRDQKIYQLKKK